MTRNRIPRSITLPMELDEWVQSKIETRDFANFTHAVEKALIMLKDNIDG